MCFINNSGQAARSRTLKTINRWDTPYRLQ